MFCQVSIDIERTHLWAASESKAQGVSELACPILVRIASVIYTQLSLALHNIIQKPEPRRRSSKRREQGEGSILFKARTKSVREYILD